ncbi:MAG: DUF3667 domain-containing protein [Bacteroidetes bacterium]|nr:DUF3667 domain-containing protein [Bacteroidota bacterium]
MSHIPQRTEKDCLNCGTIVQGRYCQVCGQENVVPHETFWHMVKHFLYDITHFDSKFFDSMKYLLFRPGFLPAEYVKGRRVRYLNPIKKYVFTSAVFFIIFFGFLRSTKSVELEMDKILTQKERNEFIEKATEKLREDPGDTLWHRAMTLLQDTNTVLKGRDMVPYMEQVIFIDIGGRKYRDRKQYDSLQQLLAPADRDGWVKRMLQYQNFKMRAKYKDDPMAGGSKLFDTFLHKLPYLLFVSLPLFALILKLLYLRRKRFYYADHGIFSIYHYIFTFLLILLVLSLNKLSDFTGWGVFEIISVLLFLSGGVYLYLSMKRFYGQGHGKTLLKFLLLNLGGVIILTFLFFVFLFVTVFQI